MQLALRKCECRLIYICLQIDFYLLQCNINAYKHTNICKLNLFHLQISVETRPLAAAQQHEKFIPAPIEIIPEQQQIQQLQQQQQQLQQAPANLNSYQANVFTTPTTAAVAAAAAGPTNVANLSQQQQQQPQQQLQPQHVGVGATNGVLENGKVGFVRCRSVLQ